MSAAKIGNGIYNIPAGTAFSKALAAQLIAETKATPEALATYRVILPTRRAARILRDAFFEITKGQALLLPHMHAVGDVEEEELSLTLLSENEEEFLNIPPAMPPLKRQVLLARTITKIPNYENNFEQSLLLAHALSQLMDQVYTEGLSFEKLADLVPAEFAQHWQITLTFIQALTSEWPKILADEGQIEAAQRRNILLQQLAEKWLKSPPQTPIIAAGSTGSIPAVARLLKVVATLPQGRVVLPGLDQDMDPVSWQNLDETHPQYILRELLTSFGELREDVALWPSGDHASSSARRALAAEIMRPSVTTSSWAQDLPLNKPLQQKIAKATQNLQKLTCANEREEAACIAVLLRETLETPGRTAALITPRRSLARRVTAVCRRWNIELDDSAGQTLDQTSTGTFLQLLALTAAADFSPVSLMALLKHPYCQIEGLNRLDYNLRGAKPAPGFKGILERDSDQILKTIAPFFDRFMNGSDPEKPRKYSEILAAHLHLAEDLATSDLLWKGEDGEAAAALFANLQEQANYFPDMSLTVYSDTLQVLMRTITVRPPFGTHPRLHILGQLEARMVDADLIIMAGLNENSWPPDPGHDPWMSRPMRKDFGLPGADRSIGLAAHDFVQGFCAPHVVLSRSLRQDGAPAVAARWLQRLSAVLKAADISEDALSTSAAILQAHALDEAAAFSPSLRPEPRPPLEARPRSLSVTQIEKWQQDPYGIYAQHILDLDKLDPLEKPIDSAEKGTLLHKILKNFAAAEPGQLPHKAEQILTKIAAEEIDKRHDDPAVWSFWKRRFKRTAAWLVGHEQDWRKAARIIGTETKGTVQLAAKIPFSLTVRADRIDQRPDGAVLIDYKSGGSYSLKAMKEGHLPQLPLEGLILSKGGFENIAALTPVSLEYWKLSGGTEPGEITKLEGDLTTTITTIESGLIALINIFDDSNTPYFALPRLDNAPRFNDYKHLARVSEWAALSENASDAEAA